MQLDLALTPAVVAKPRALVRLYPEAEESALSGIGGRDHPQRCRSRIRAIPAPAAGIMQAQRNSRKASAVRSQRSARVISAVTSYVTGASGIPQRVRLVLDDLEHARQQVVHRLVTARRAA